MDYKEKVIALLNNQELSKEQKEKLENIFPELQESEDEKIRKGLIKAVSDILKGNTLYGTDVTREEALAWLEKQGQESKKVSIWKHWKNGIAGNGEGRQIYLIRTGNTYDLSSCLGFECDYIELSELDNLMLKKQSEQTHAKLGQSEVTKTSDQELSDKIEPKFKVDDWITDGHLTCKVLSVTGKSYELHLYNDDYCHFETDVQSVNKHYHLWTINDAKEGDVLVYEDKNFTIPFIAIYKCLSDTVCDYRGLKDVTFISHCFIGLNGNFHEGEDGHVIEGIHPGTKEQRDLLFKKMKEAGYEWDANKKELKKIEVVSKESEDERIKKTIIRILKGEIGYTSTEDVDKYVTWLEKQEEPKDKGEISDGYHTFNELYEYRKLYNAAFFNLLPKHMVHKSKRHHDGEECFGGGWFIVVANLPTGQISNHYRLKDWNLFQVPEKFTADEWDGHTPQDAADRLHKYLLEKQWENKTIEANKVIEWLKITIEERVMHFRAYKDTRLILPYNSIEDLINDFKEDFNL